MGVLTQRPEIIRCLAHLVFVKTLPCCLSGYIGPEVDAHHLLRTPNNEHAGARKSGDNWTLPIRHWLHMDLHFHKDHGGNEPEFLRRFRIWGPGLASTLWILTGNHVACVRAIEEAPYRCAEG